MEETNSASEKEGIEKIEIKKIFVLDEDGIFKELLPKRILAPLSNFLSWEERKAFFFRGEIPKRLENIFREVQNATAKQTYIGENKKRLVRISLEVRKSILGLEITCRVYKKLKEKKGDKEKQNEMRTASGKSEKGELVIFMTQPQPKITIITEGRNIYGDKDILNFFVAK